jgi:hypothetical protein
VSEDILYLIIIILSIVQKYIVLNINVCLNLWKGRLTLQPCLATALVIIMFILHNLSNFFNISSDISEIKV